MSLHDDSISQKIYEVTDYDLYHKVFERIAPDTRMYTNRQLAFDFFTSSVDVVGFSPDEIPADVWYTVADIVRTAKE